MCEDGTQWRVHEDYRKHNPPRGLTPAQIVDGTRDGEPALYFRVSDRMPLEEIARAAGVYVACGSITGNKVCKVHEFPDLLGASEGLPSRWLFVESTSGRYHGRPISHRVYLEKLKAERPCCDEA
jgi:hypothetical protein